MSKMGDQAAILAKRQGGVYSFPYRHCTLKENDSYGITRRSACCAKGVHKDMIEIDWVRKFDPERLVNIPSMSPIKTYLKHTGFWRCNKCDNLTSTYQNYIRMYVRGPLKIYNPVYGFNGDQDEMGWSLRQMSTPQFASWIKSRLATFWACDSKDKAKELGCPLLDICPWCSPEGKKKAKWLVRVKENNPNKSLDFWTGCPASIDPPTKRTPTKKLQKMTRKDVRRIINKEVVESVGKMGTTSGVVQAKSKKRAKKKTKRSATDVLGKMTTTKKEE